jgi:2,5-diketo-D-gluconate reductase A
MNAVPTVKLNNGVEIPQLGFGVFQVPPADTVEAVTTALRIGYRHIDTAEMYGNEKQVGEAIARSALDRSEVFVTSKLNNGAHDFDAALTAFDSTLTALGSDTIDLFLIHWPLPTVSDFAETWKAMERIYRDGRARAIGVSNFQADHLRRLEIESEVTPAVNQIELHPYFTAEAARVQQRKLHRHGGVVPHRPGRGAEGPAGQRAGGQLRADPGADRAALAHSVGNIVFPSPLPRSGSPRISTCSASNWRRRTWSGSPRSTRTSVRDQTRTRST